MSPSRLNTSTHFVYIHADFASASAGYGVYLAGTPGVLPTTGTVTPIQVTGGYCSHQWTTSFVFKSGTEIFTTDEGYSVGQ